MLGFKLNHVSKRGNRNQGKGINRVYVWNDTVSKYNDESPITVVKRDTATFLLSQNNDTHACQEYGSCNRRNDVCFQYQQI